jgi:ribosomal protein S18 acetylase RimI-like enzyme
MDKRQPPDARPAVAVREAARKDAEGIARAHVLSWRVGYEGLMPGKVLRELSIYDREMRWEAILSGDRSAGARTWTTVAEAGGEIVGFAGGGPSRDQDTAGDGELYAIYVAPEHWNEGIGSRLVDDALHRLADGGAAHAQLWVLEDNARGRRFYERCGWSADGSRKPIDLLGGVVTAMCVRYRRALTP